MWLTPKPKVRILPPSPESPDTPPDADLHALWFAASVSRHRHSSEAGSYWYLRLDNKHRRIRGKTNIDAENYITGAQLDTQDAFTPEVAPQNAASSSTIPPSPSGDAMDIAEDAADEAEAKNMFD